MPQETRTSLLVTTPSDLEIVMTRVFDAPRHLVFDAWTKPEHLKRWFGAIRGWTMQDCQVDLRLGGSWRYELHGPDGARMVMKGVYRVIDPPGRIVSTEVFEGPEFEEMGGGTLNTMTFEEQNGKTTMTISSLYQSKEARDGALQTGMEGGAGESFDRLAELLEQLV